MSTVAINVGVVDEFIVDQVDHLTQSTGASAIEMKPQPRKIGKMIVVGFQPMDDSLFNPPGIDDIAVATGYRADQIKALGCRTFHNPKYDQTNMVASMMAGESWFDGQSDLIVAYGDIVYSLGLSVSPKVSGC